MSAHFVYVGNATPVRLSGKVSTAAAEEVVDVPSRDHPPYGSVLARTVSDMCTIHPGVPGEPVFADNRNPLSAVVARACSSKCWTTLDLARDPATRRLTPVRARNAARRARQAEAVQRAFPTTT